VECLGWQDRIGTLEEGKLADITVSKTNLLAQIDSLENPDNITLVTKGGVIQKDLLTV